MLKLNFLAIHAISFLPHFCLSSLLCLPFRVFKSFRSCGREKWEYNYKNKHNKQNISIHMFIYLKERSFYDILDFYPFFITSLCGGTPYRLTASLREGIFNRQYRIQVLLGYIIYLIHQNLFRSCRLDEVKCS